MTMNEIRDFNVDLVELLDRSISSKISLSDLANKLNEMRPKYNEYIKLRKNKDVDLDIIIALTDAIAKYDILLTYLYLKDEDEYLSSIHSDIIAYDITNKKLSNNIIKYIFDNPGIQHNTLVDLLGVEEDLLISFINYISKYNLIDRDEEEGFVYYHLTNRGINYYYKFINTKMKQ